MRNWESKAKPKARIEIIPMIDVMMFLLVFFVLISINVIPALGLKTELPKSSQAAALPPQHQVVITLGKTGEIMLEGQNRRLQELPAYLNRIKQQKGPLSIVINGDQGADIQRLVDIMDVLQANGYGSVSIASKKKSV